MSKMIIDKEYYSDNTRISNSAIGWFLKKGPRYLRDMLDGKEEGISGKFLDRGTMIHEYILQPEEFWKDYEILDFEVPKVKQQKELCEKYYNYKLTNPLESEDRLLLDAYNFAYSNKKSDEQKLTEARDITENYAKYIKYLEIESKKKVISFSDLTMLKQIKTNLEEHIAANKLLFDVPTTYDCHNEFHINWDYKGIPCKSLLDRVMFDHVNKKIILIDLKTTSDVYNFKHSVEEYDYYRQITYYLLAISWYMKDQEIDISDYDCEAYIIAIQTNSNNEIRVFNMFNETELESQKNKIITALSELSYHYQSNNWDHTHNYYEGDGIEEL